MSGDFDGVNEALEDMKEFLAELETMSADFSKEEAVIEAENKEADEEDARKRRDGEYGPQWQTLQRRIDLNQTTLFDIRTGIDKSPEARAIRELISENAAVARNVVVDTLAADAEGSYVDELIQANEELDRTMAELAELFQPGDTPDPR